MRDIAAQVYSRQNLVREELLSIFKQDLFIEYYTCEGNCANICFQFKSSRM